MGIQIVVIDETLTRLIREAGQALDAIESPEHKAEMDKLAALDNERVALAEAVQSRIIAYTNAQEAILAYRVSASDTETYGIDADELREAVLVHPMGFSDQMMNVNQSGFINPTLTDEFSESRAPFNCED